MNELICIRCPLGCHIKIDENGNPSGNGCLRGAEYAKEELTDPRRIITCVVRIQGAEEPLSLKTTSGVPKRLVFDCLHAIKALHVRVPVRLGDTVLRNVCGTGVDVVATKTLP